GSAVERAALARGNRRRSRQVECATDARTCERVAVVEARTRSAGDAGEAHALGLRESRVADLHQASLSRYQAIVRFKPLVKSSRGRHPSSLCNRLASIA